MNLKLFVLVFFSIFIIPYVLAQPVDIEFEKKSYLTGETVQGKLFINENVEEEIKITDFHLDLNESKTNVYPTLIKFDNHTYFYFDIPYDLDKGKYQLVIENVVYLENNVLIQEDQNFDFTIDIKNGSILSINPAIVIFDASKEKYFEINIFNPTNTNTLVNITSSDDFISPEVESFSLKSDSSKKIKINFFRVLADKSESLILIEYDNLFYNIPIIIESISSISGNDSDYTPEEKLNFLEEDFTFTIKKNESVPGFVKIFNNFNNEILNVKISLSDNLRELIDLEFEEISSIKPGGVIKNHLYINENKNSTIGNYSGRIDLVYNNEVYDSVSINLEVLGESTANQTSSNNTAPPDDENSDEEDNRTTVIIWILVFILVFLISIYIKYLISKKSNKGFSFLKR